jgi:hypothetical protein
MMERFLFSTTIEESCILCLRGCEDLGELRRKWLLLSLGLRGIEEDDEFERGWF